MKLEKWALVAETVGALAIVFSLVFVGRQVRQGANETAANTEALRSQVRESMLASDLGILSEMLDRPYLFNNEFDPAQTSSDELAQRVVFMYMLARTREHFSSQHRLGVLDDDTYVSYRIVLTNAIQASSFYRNVWNDIQNEFSDVPDFVSEINTVLAGDLHPRHPPR
jgi:hypothetical protein